MRKLSHWTDQEDKLLLELYESVHCFQRWKYISEELKKRDIKKSQVECRERYVNKLNPELRKDKLEPEELKALFTYYDQYGPLWSVFQSLIPGRSQNLLKNKFYSTLRSFVRLIMLAGLRAGETQSNTTSGPISSKLLVEIYEGKKSFRKFKGPIKNLFRRLNYDFEHTNWEEIENFFGYELLQKLNTLILQESQTGRTKTRRIKNFPLEVAASKENKSQHPPQPQNKVEAACIKKEQTEVIEEPEENPVEPLPSMNVYYPGMPPMNMYYPFWNMGYPCSIVYPQ